VKTVAFDVFLSYDAKDTSVVERVWEILRRVKISAYMAERFSEYEYTPETVKKRIRECKCFVVFLTQEGIRSPRVNQEIGIAYAFDRLMIPIQEKRWRTKGTVALRKYIRYNPSNLEDMIHNLIVRLRVLLSRDHKQTKGLILVCSCGKEFEVDLPSCENILNTIKRKMIYAVECPKCHSKIKYSPKTLEAI
jgi:hypothetical protein